MSSNLWIRIRIRIETNEEPQHWRRMTNAGPVNLTKIDGKRFYPEEQQNFVCLLPGTPHFYGPPYHNLCSS